MTNFIDKDKILYMLSGRITDCIEIADGANSETEKKRKEKYLEAARDYTFVYKFIAQIPTVEAEPVRHGKWKLIKVDNNDNGDYECSECHFRDEHSTCVKVPYCWHCGARMGGEGKCQG